MLCPKGTKPMKLNTKFDLQNQRVIKTDVLRTKTGYLTETEMHSLELLLTYYCKDTNTSYKQGMNEIFSNFLLLTRQGLTLDQAYIMSKNFINHCLLTMFKDDVIFIQTFRPAQMMFLITKILLRYKNPVLSNYLQNFCISPELYATSWFLTLFATKIPDLGNTFSLWKEILREKDSIFPCYLAIALLEHYQTQVESKAFPNPAQAISKISITSAVDLRDVIIKARRIKDSMPHSWKFQLMNYDIFNLQTIDTVISSLSKDICLKIFPREIIQRTYPGDACPCGTSCFWCQEKKMGQMIIIDCRPEIEQQAGVLPNSQLIDAKCYYNAELIEPYLDTIQGLIGTFHFILLGTSDFEHNGFDIRYVENPSTSQEMIEDIYYIMTQKGIPFVSIAQGGFKRCHELIAGFKFSLQDHLPEYCLVCNPNGSKYQAKMKFGLKRLTNSVTEAFKTTITKVTTRFNSFVTSSQGEIDEVDDYINSTLYVCRKFDKATNEKSDEEFSLVIKKNEIILARYINHEPNKIIKMLESIQMKELLKITSMKKFPNVLTFIAGDKQLCIILENIKDAKECIVLVTQYFRDIKMNN